MCCQPHVLAELLEGKTLSNEFLEELKKSQEDKEGGVEVDGVAVVANFSKYPDADLGKSSAKSKAKSENKKR